MCIIWSSAVHCLCPAHVTRCAAWWVIVLISWQSVFLYYLLHLFIICQLLLLLCGRFIAALRELSAILFAWPFVPYRLLTQKQKGIENNSVKSRIAKRFARKQQQFAIACFVSLPLWWVTNLHLTHCVIDTDNRTCQMASKSVERFKQAARQTRYLPRYENV